jgi:hypothetical protein
MEELINELKYWELTRRLQNDDRVILRKIIEKMEEKQLTLTDVVVPKGTFNCGKERAFGEERCKVQCKDCVIEYQYN